MFRKFISTLSFSISLTKKIILVLVVYTIILGLLAHFIQEDKKSITTKKTSKYDTYTVINDPELNNSKEGKMAIAAYKVFMCSFTGEACTDNPSDDKKNAQNSISIKIGKFLASPYLNPPASGTQWVTSTLANAGFIPSVYATQGSGFAGIMPLNPIWKLFRNIAYTLLVLVIITIGFLIMFRAKLEAQTVISIENSLPRIAISLLMITFSFPIAGFFIDIMYVIIGLSVSTLASIDLSSGPLDTTRTEGQLLSKYLAPNLGDIWGSIFPDGKLYQNFPIFGLIWSPFYDITRIGNAIIGLFPKFLNDTVRLIAAIAFIPNIMAFFGKSMNLESFGSILDNIDIVGTGLGKVPGAILKPLLAFFTLAIVFPLTILFGAGFIVGVLVLLTVIFLMFRIFFMLFFGYLRLLMLIIFSPIILMFEAIPGQSTFSNWIKNLISELIMFPTVIVLLIVGEMIHSLPANNTIMWQPPFIYGLDGESFGILVGIGFIFLIPDLVKVLRESIGAKPFPVKVGLNTYLGGIGSVGGAALGSVSGFGGLSMSLPGLRNIIASTNLLPKGLRNLFVPTTGEPEVHGTKTPGEHPGG